MCPDFHIKLAALGLVTFGIWSLYKYGNLDPDPDHGTRCLTPCYIIVPTLFQARCCLRGASGTEICARCWDGNHYGILPSLGILSLVRQILLWLSLLSSFRSPFKICLNLYLPLFPSFSLRCECCPVPVGCETDYELITKGLEMPWVRQTYCSLLLLLMGGLRSWPMISPTFYLVTMPVMRLLYLTQGLWGLSP